MSSGPDYLSLVPYRARVDRRVFLNLPGWHAGAHVVAYVEDTSQRPLPDDDSYAANFEPRTILEIADCSNRVAFSFDIDTAPSRANSLYKLDTLIGALSELRRGLVDEFDEYEQRAAELERRAEVEAEAEVEVEVPAA